MVPFRHLVGLCMAGAHLAGLSNAATAADALPSEDDFLAPVPRVTSAARLERPLLEMGMSVTIIDRETIEASPAIEIPDLLRLVPGFQVTHATGAVFATAYHGASDQYPRRMEVMVDGRSVYMNSYSTVEWGSLGLAIEDIERIEVVRGPNAPSFGSNAVTGSINIVTRAPFLLRGKYLRGTVGALDTGNAVARWGGTLGAWESSLTAQYRADDGFDDVNDHKRLADLRYRGDWQATPTDQLSVQLGLTDGEIGADGDAGAADDPFRDREIRSHYQQLTWNREALDGNRYRVNLSHQYDDHDDGYAIDISGYPVPPDYDSVFPAGTTAPLGLFVTTSERVDVEFQHTLAPRDAWRLAWGLGGRYDRLSSDTLLGDLDRVERLSGRVFGSLEWHPVDDLAVSLDALTEKHEGYRTLTSPRIGLNWLATDSRSLRAGASRSYRAFSLLERYADYRLEPSTGDPPLFSLFTTAGEHDLEPEKVTGYELGYSERWDSLGLYLDLRLFRDRFEGSGEAVRAPPPPKGAPYPSGLLWRDQAGDWKTRGFEVQLDYRPGPATRLLAAYSRARIEGEAEKRLDADYEVSRWEDLSDTVPLYSFSALLSHRFDPHWSGSLAVYHLDEMRWRGDGGDVDDYTRVDLKLARDFRLAKGRGQLALIVHNLADEQYNEFRDPDDTAREGNFFDRRAYLQLSLAFD